RGAGELWRRDRAPAPEHPGKTDGGSVVRDVLGSGHRLASHPALEEQHAPERRPERDAHPRSRFAVERRRRDRLRGRAERQRTRAIGIVQRDFAYLGGIPRLEVFCRERRDGRYGGATSDEPFPERTDAAPDGRDDPETRDDGGARRVRQCRRLITTKARTRVDQGPERRRPSLPRPASWLVRVE